MKVGREVWTPDQQRTTPQARRIAQHPGHAEPHINKSIKCGISGISAGGIG
jgi:hypothetical protein